MPKSIVKIIKDNLVISIVVVVVVVFVAVVSVMNYGSIGGVSANGAGDKAVQYINDYLASSKQDGSAKLISAEKYSGMYKIQFSLTLAGKDQGNQVAYVTTDGKYLFPEMQGIPISLEAAKVPAANNTTTGDTTKVTTADTIKKADKPLLEAFVVSACPYGLQMQRVLANVVNAVGLTSNIKVRYIGAVSGSKLTSMHGDAEGQENLRQICIREEQPTKYWPYLNCYMKKSGNGDACAVAAGIDTAKLTACTTDTSRGIKFAQADFDLANKYGVSGSPTLIINGNTTDEFSFGGRTADSLKTIICAGFNTKPAVCSQTLSKETAATAFSATYTGSGASGNSGATGANCAPAQ